MMVETGYASCTSCSLNVLNAEYCAPRSAGSSEYGSTSFGMGVVASVSSLSGLVLSAYTETVEMNT